MTKNRLLNIATVLCKFTKGLFTLAFIGLTFVFVHIQIHRDYYKDKKVDFDKHNYTYSMTHKVKTETADKAIFTIENIKTYSLYITYFQLSGLLVVLFLGTKEFQKVLESVKKVTAFEADNVTAFRRIGKLIFIYALLTSFSILEFNEGGFRGFGIPIKPIILILFAFIMAEVFKEGHALKQENDLTI